MLLVHRPHRPWIQAQNPTHLIPNPSRHHWQQQNAAPHFPYRRLSQSLGRQTCRCKFSADDLGALPDFRIPSADSALWRNMAPPTSAFLTRQAVTAVGRSWNHSWHPKCFYLLVARNDQPFCTNCVKISEVNTLPRSSGEFSRLRKKERWRRPLWTLELDPDGRGHLRRQVSVRRKRLGRPVTWED